MVELTVLGIGNILMQDEGIGVRLMEAAMVAHDWPEEIEFIDGGAGGLNLLNFIEQAKRMVVIDAADMGLAPGEHRLISPEQVRDDTPEHRVSMHDVPFMETLKLCEQFSRRPDRVRLFVVQPKSIDFGQDLTIELTAAFDRLLQETIDLIRSEAGEASLTV